MNLIWVQLEAYGALNEEKNFILNKALDHINYKTVNLTQTICAAPSTVMTSMGMLTGVPPVYLAKDHIPKSQKVPDNFQAIGFTAISDFLEEQGYQVKGINAVYDSPRFLPMFKDTHEGVTTDMEKEDDCNFWKSWCVVQRTKNILEYFKSDKKATFFHLMDAEILPEILSLLETIGFNENNTVLVLVGDHGWPIRFKEKEPALFHDLHQEENNIRVACYLGYPGSSSTSYDHFNSALDLAPTVLDIMGFNPTKVLPKAHGISLKPYLVSNSPTPERIIRIDNRYIAQRKNKVITLVNSSFRYTYRYDTSWQHQPYYQYRLEPVKENEELYSRDDIDENNNHIDDQNFSKTIDMFRNYLEKSETDILKHFYGENIFEHYLLKEFSPKKDKFENHRLHSSSRIQTILLKLLSDELNQKKIEKVALYGAGNHTLSILKTGILNKFIKVIIDDSPLIDSLSGIPVIPTENASKYKFEILVISSDYFEKQLYERAVQWSPKDIEVMTLYEGIGKQLTKFLTAPLKQATLDKLLEKIIEVINPGKCISLLETPNEKLKQIKNCYTFNSSSYKEIAISLPEVKFDLIVYQSRNVFEFSEWLSRIDELLDTCGFFVGELTYICQENTESSIPSIIPDDFKYEVLKLENSFILIGHLWRFNS